MKQVAPLVLLMFAGAIASCTHSPAKAKQADFQRGREFYRKSLYGDAEVQFRKALQEDPRFGEAALWLARALKQRGKYAAAVDSLNQEIELDPAQTAPKVELVNLLLLSYLVDPSHPEEIRQKISQLSTELLVGGMDTFDGTRIRATLALADGHASEAAALFEQANAVKPNEPDVITGLIESLVLDNRGTRAEEIARDCLKANPACGPLYAVLYERYMASRRFDEAEALLKNQIAGSPKEIQYRLQLARHYLRAGKAQQSSDLLNQLLADKQFPDSLLAVADFYLESRNWTEARRLYEQGLTNNPKGRPTYWKRLVRVDLATNEIAGARQLLDQILKETPGDAEAISTQAGLFMSSKDSQQRKLAVAEFKDLVSRFPDNPAYHMQYADALCAAGDLEGAHAQYIAVLQREPRDLPALHTLADISIRQQRFDDALTYANRALALDPHSARARLVESAALVSKRKFAESRTILTQLIKEQPNLRQAQFQLALLDVEDERYSDAEKRFLKYYLPGNGDVLALEGLIQLYWAKDQPSKAITLLETDLEKNPQSDEVRSLLADTAFRSGEYDLSIAQYEKLSRTQPNSAAVAMRLGLAYERKLQPDRSAAQFERATKLAPEDPRAYAYLSQALEESGHRAEAITADRRSLLLDAHNPWVLNNLAYLLADTGGDLNEAMKLSLEAVRLAPEDIGFSDTLGWVYLKKGDTATAAHIFQAACQKNNKNVVFHVHLATALLAAGNRNGSLSELAFARQLSPSRKDEDSINRLLAKIGATPPQVP